MFMYRYEEYIPSTYTKQNERHIVFIPLLEIGDFESRIKQKTLSYLYRRFLPPGGTKIRFSFTMQRSMRILFLQTYGKYFEVDSSGLKDFVFRCYKVMRKMKQSPISPNKNSPNRKNTIRGVHSITI